MHFVISFRLSFFASAGRHCLRYCENTRHNRRRIAGAGPVCVRPAVRWNKYNEYFIQKAANARLRLFNTQARSVRSKQRCE